MVLMYLAVVAVLAASLVCGQAVWKLCRLSDGGALAPVVGFALLVVVSTDLVILPGHATTAAAGVLALVAVSLAIVGRPRVDAQILLVSLATTVVASLPFIANGRFGILGVSVDDDMASHLFWADVLRSGNSVPELIPPSYPIGPHALAATLARLLHTDVDHTFIAVLVVVPVLTAITALSVLGALSPMARLGAAVLVGLPYLAASYLGQGSFKEPIHALLILAFALVLRQARLGQGSRVHLAAPVAVIVSATLLVRGWPGLLWIGPMAACLALGPRVFRRQRRPEVVRKGPALALLAVSLASVALPLLPHASRAISFRPNLAGGQGNLPRELAPFQALGLWLTGDFRAVPAFDLTLVAGVCLALAVSLYAAAAWVRRRDVEIPLLVVTSTLLYLGARQITIPYFTAKILMAGAPALMLMTLRSLFTPGREGWWRRARGVTAVTFSLAAAASSSLALRDAQVGPTSRASELDGVRRAVSGQPTLFLTADHFGYWKLRGAQLTLAWGYSLGPEIPLRHRPGKPIGPGFLIDFDSIEPAKLDLFRYAVTTRSAYASEPPGNWRMAKETASYRLWERFGPTPRRRILREGPYPGAELSCGDPSSPSRPGVNGVAGVRAPPVVGQAADWILSETGRRWGEGLSEVSAGESAYQVLDLPPGRWEISLQYASPVALEVRAPGLRVSLPPSLDVVGPFWVAGSVRVEGGPVRFEVAARDSWLSRGRVAALGVLAATRVDRGVEVMPLEQSCDRYVDWYQIEVSQRSAALRTVRSRPSSRVTAGL